VESSEANRFRVTVESLRDQGSTLQVELTGDLSLRALLTHREARELGLRAGLELWARLPIDALHLIPDAVRGSEG
jgi:hypothetical protein